jgi:hypothetical protein
MPCKLHTCSPVTSVMFSSGDVQPQNVGLRKKSLPIEIVTNQRDAFVCHAFGPVQWKTSTTALRLGLDAGLVVGDLDAELLGAGDDVDALAGGNGVGDLGGEGGVVHEEELDVVNCRLR